ncbi:MAG: ABC-2 family transporter protein, partial [Anaerolineaceae bacterium]|nr:ABC-2 family transporter protein [Anaerolineaceae bacterium]
MRKIFWRLWQINWAEQWQYRANLIMYLFYWLVSPIVFLSVWRSVAAAQGTVSGLTANDFTVYYLLLLLVSQITREITIHILEYKIQDGTLSNELLLPVHPILTSALVYNLAFKALTFLGLIPIWIALALLFRADFSAVTLLNVLLALAAAVGGFAINFYLGTIITCVAFWTTRVYSLSDFIYGFVMILGGTFVPLSLLPPFAQAIAQALPFQLLIYFPIQLALGKLSPEQVLVNFGLQVFWLAATALGFRWIW